VDLELLEWRIAQLEENLARVRAGDLAVEKAMQLELHDLRNELHAALRRDYLTAAEMRNLFPTRDELAKRAAVRREWPLILFGGVMAACQLTTLILVVGGHG
jgi:hypothetical protein